MGEPEAYSSAEFLQYLVSGMAEGVIFIDEKNIIRLCNPVGGEIRGVKGKDIIGTPLLSCHPSNTHEKVLRVVEELKNGGRDVTRTVRFKGGYYEHTYSAVRDSMGKFLGVVAVSRNTTARENLEKELKEHSERLERSNQIKDLFSDIIRHDLLNPAGIISNYAEILLEEQQGEVSKDVRAIKKNIDRIIEMLENASKYSRLEDAENLPFVETEIGSLLKQILEEYRPMAEGKDIEVVEEIDSEYKAQANRFIEDVFSNIISNAIKYSPEKSRIELRLIDEGESLLLSVADHAERIPEKFREAIFERFKRVEKEGVKGSGLGLAIAKRIVDIHGGEIWVAENPSGGNIFYVRLLKKRR